MVAVPVAPNPFYAALMIGVELVEVADLLDPPSWHDDALCREFSGVVNWFPKRGEPTEAAKLICRRCLVRHECLTFALDRLDEAGVWGGTTPGDRERARKLDLTADELLAHVDRRRVLVTLDPDP